MGMDDSNLLVQCDFEVFGHVQGMEFHSNVHKFFIYPIFCIFFIQVWDLQKFVETIVPMLILEGG